MASENPVARLDEALEHYRGLVRPHVSDPGIAALWAALSGMMSEVRSILDNVVTERLSFNDDQVRTLTLLCQRCTEVIGALQSDNDLETETRQRLADVLGEALGGFMAVFFPLIGADPSMVQAALDEGGAERDGEGDGEPNAGPNGGAPAPTGAP